MPARFLQPGSARRLPVSWREAEWTPPIRARRSRQNSKRFEDHQPTFPVFSVPSPQSGTPASSQKNSSYGRVSPFPAFKPKLSRDKRIDPFQEL